MDLEKVFHMNGGQDETSYAANSSHQKGVGDRIMPIILEAIEKTYLSLKPESMGIANLGCSSDPKELDRVKILVDTLENASRSIHRSGGPELLVCLNDLPTNDFNTILKDVPDLHNQLMKGRVFSKVPSIFIAAYPGSFYGRLFPTNSLHFVYSLFSLHWLSRIPPGIYDDQNMSLNKNSIYLTKNSPLEVCNAYLKQFQEDFSFFLESRSVEIVSGGRMVVLMFGRDGPNMSQGGTTFLWEVLYQAFSKLIAKGLVEEEKVNSYDVHYFEPCIEEIKDAVVKEGSFSLYNFEVHRTENKSVSNTSPGKIVAKNLRAVQQSLIAHHFGAEILDILFDEYERLYDQLSLTTEVFKTTSLAFVLKRI